ncbi:MAG: hypothetical protein WC544_03255 [Patescibacteria group bacterium]
MREHTNFLIISLTLILLGTLIPGLAAAQPDKGMAHFELTLSFRQDPLFTVSHFPLEPRSVPLHPDDGYLRYDSIANSPLRDTTLHLHRSTCIDFSGRYYPAEYFCIGTAVSLHSKDEGTINSDQRYQQNQYGDADRGYGTSLRWYQLGIKPFQVSVNAALSTPWIEPVRRFLFRIQAGGVYDLTGFTLTTENGYDRWSSDEDWKSFSIGRLYEHCTFVSLQLGTPIIDHANVLKQFFAYVTYSQPYYSFSSNSMYRDTKVIRQNTRSWSGGIGVSF